MKRAAPLVGGPGLALSLLILGAPVLRAQQAVFTGELADDQFGASVRGVGDLNGDGVEDFAVGAPGNDAAGSEAGRVYIYFGRHQNLPTEPDLILNSPVAAAAFGSAVAGIGRFNGDAFDDLAVGAPLSNAGGTGRGQVFIFYGGNPMNAVPDLTLSGQQGGDHFGAALDGGFDYNNDTFDDVVVGAPDRPTVNGLQSGEVRIFFGGSSPANTTNFVILGQAALDQLGFAVHGAGDFNADGYDDVVIGAPQQFQLNSGRAYVYFGVATGTTTIPVLTLHGENGGDRFGWSVGGGGDVNADGFADVVIGAPRHDSGATNNGAAYLFLGAAASDDVFDARVAGRTGGDELGTAVSVSGDYNGDGRADLLAGAPSSNAVANNAGEISLWLGDAPLNAGSRENFPGPFFNAGFQAEDLFGSAVDFVDYNGDGQWEIIAGSPLGNLASGDRTGLVSLIFSPGTFVPVVLENISVVPAGDRARLSWTVADDPSLLGFHVERRQPQGEWVRLTATLLTGDPSGRYVFEDKDPVLALGGYFDYRLIVVTRSGLADSFGPFRVAMAPSVRPILEQNYPNPFAAPATSIPIHVPEATDATVDIFDPQGRVVRHLFSGRMEAGVTVLSWDGKDDRGDPLPSGSYLARFESRGTVFTRKLTLAR